jgi:hypothetical protein
VAEWDSLREVGRIRQPPDRRNHLRAITLVA